MRCCKVNTTVIETNITNLCIQAHVKSMSVQLLLSFAYSAVFLHACFISARLNEFKMSMMNFSLTASSRSVEADSISDDEFFYFWSFQLTYHIMARLICTRVYALELAFNRFEWKLIHMFMYMSEGVELHKWLKCTDEWFTSSIKFKVKT